ncbi:PRAME family member 25-like [Tenrec ecaudatus]|uniref:PRAME family member 25-like n=1 Tax=Tenrec ecaudatus TaxID=94439 RepID=UPI003F5913D5
MSSRNPPRFLDLAIQVVLQNEASAMAALDWLPTELFPPLFVAAAAGGHNDVMKAMVVDWPFIRLPLGLSWNELLAFLNERVNQGKVLPSLLCRKLEFVSLSELPIIEEILNAVQPDSVQVGLHCGWNLRSLQWFLPYLFQMGHLSTLHLSRISLDLLRSPSFFKMEKILRKLASFLLRLHQLHRLVMEYVFFVNDQLDQLLRCVLTGLEALALKNCLPLDSDMSSLCLCPCTSQLRSLDLSGIFMARLNHGFLPSLLERVSATLTHLNLADCGINDSRLTALQPALGQCSQLSTLLLGRNRVSMAVLQGLLQHSLPLCKFSLLGLPVPQDCYDHP